MEARTALLAAIVCGGLAVALVAADTAWGLEARLETQQDGSWRTVASAPFTGSYDRFERLECANQDVRLVVTNDKPWGDTFDVRVSFHNQTSQRTTILLDETWSLDSFDARTYRFTLPDDAFRADNETDDRPKQIYADVTAQVGDLYLNACIQQEVRA